ncbi:hypothetical protein LZ31DRAFT_617047 [Colletotrichum somersetense]|nr:hypothetical protein LZ31DRAFT_617047 [Colletotrichum somersetense]
MVALLPPYSRKQSTYHALKKDDFHHNQPPDKSNFLHILEDRHPSAALKDIMPESAAAGFSTVGRPQTLALNRIFSTVDLVTLHR